MQKVKTLQRQVLGIRQSCWTLLPVGGVHRLCMFMEDSNASSSRRRACSQWLSISRHMSPLMSQPQQVGYATQKITIYNESSAKLWTDLSNIKRDCSISEWMSSGLTSLERCKEIKLEAEKYHSSCDRRPTCKVAPITEKEEAPCIPPSVFYLSKLPVISEWGPYPELHNAKTNAGWRVGNFNMIPGKAYINVRDTNKNWNTLLIHKCRNFLKERTENTCSILYFAR